MAQQKKTSPWVYVAIGCGGLLVVGLIAVAASLFFVGKKAKEFADDMSDPAKRQEKVMQVLGAEQLPEGYYPSAAFSLFGLMDMAIISDQPPGPEQAGKSLGERGFIYFAVRANDKDRREFQEFIEGRREDTPIIAQSPVSAQSEEVIQRGSIDVGGRTVAYVAQRGQVNYEGETRHGITTWVAFSCPQSKKIHMGLWYAPDAESLEGTPADEQALKDFLAPLDPCG